MNFTLTEEKIKVTHLMMDDAGLTRGSQYGIPYNPQNISDGVTWKNAAYLDEEDYDKLEDYFIKKQAA